jgi:hypothetical protein
MSSWTYESIRRDAAEFKEQSQHDPDGVMYMDHLWEMIEGVTGPLAVVLRTPSMDRETFTDVPVEAHWSHGRYDWQDDTDKEGSDLVFAVPEEVTRRIQSEHARSVMRRLFGGTKEVELDKPFLREDGPSNGLKDWGEDTHHEIVVGDWDKLKTAIKLTSQDTGGALGGQVATVLGPVTRHAARVRIEHEKLEVCLGPETIEDMHKLWSQAFRREVLLED